MEYNWRKTLGLWRTLPDQDLCEIQLCNLDANFGMHYAHHKSHGWEYPVIPKLVSASDASVHGDINDGLDQLYGMSLFCLFLIQITPRN